MKQNLPFRPKLRSIGSKNSIVTVKYIELANKQIVATFE